MSNSVLQETLSTIELEDGEFNKSFDLVNKLLVIYGERNLAERLYSEIPSECSWKVVANLFAILIWSTTDNGTALTEVTDNWLVEGNDVRKIQIALNLDTYPFQNRDRMIEVLSKLAIRYPEVSAKCSELIASRRNLKE
jgi:hypothetical protein